MSGTSRLDALVHVHPEWAGWLRVVRAVTAELSHPAWDSGPPQTQPAEGAPVAGGDDTAHIACDLTPMLAGALLRPDARAVVLLLDHLLETARAQGLPTLGGDGHRVREPTTEDALALFLAAVNGEQTLPEAPASRTGASPEGLHAIAQLLPMPYLHACARRWAASPGRGWSQGYCPVCGAWPAFAELRGVERSRHLRCGRCGAGWPMPVLACTYCATTDHDTLGTLVVEDRTPRFAVDVCHACSGYLKTCTTLQATPSDEVVATDLASVDFDLAAVDRGYRRPPGPGFVLRASIAAAEPALPAPPGRWSWARPWG